MIFDSYLLFDSLIFLKIKDGDFYGVLFYLQFRLVNTGNRYLSFSQSRQSAKIFLKPSELGLPPNPSPASECAPLPSPGGGGGTTLACERGGRSKAVNREDKLSRRYRDRDLAKFESSRRYRERLRCFLAGAETEN